MPAPEKIKQLVQTFEQNLSEYHTRKNETELRRQFLDPFFEALGWDVSNNKGNDERRKEVAHELSVEIDGQQKKADYAFRTPQKNTGQAGSDKFDFLVEAKKPSVKIESDPKSAFQVKRYGWSAKLPINILTDFEHFAVYDCRIKPNYKDKVTAGRISLFHYKDYIEKWDEIAALFSPDAIRAGALNEFTEGLKTKKGTADVDDDFLAEIERWRDLLARNIANRNKDKALTESQLNYAVQMTIDRIVFLRIAEERGMEAYGRLKDLCEKQDIYSRLKQYFLKADERYNSGLFHFKSSKKTLRDLESLRVSQPDTVTFNLQIDDKALEDIIENLYEPKSPYAFAYIPTDILGSVYERFLGKVIRLTPSGQAKVEDKPEVRKAGGVYYTPVYIVEYIVRNTVGKLTEGKTPKEVSEIKVVDPACGSGSFLLGAYQYLLNWHLDWYTQNDPDKHLKNKVLLTQDNKTYRLSMNEKKRILLNNIHGVDVDPQAVEVTKLSLLLKVVEDPGQLTMFEEGHILPDLGNNIKCGNSLIGMDYFEGQLMADAEESARVNPFDWKTEFTQVFKRGGFDAVIGNPPYDVMEKERGESSWPHNALIEYTRLRKEYTFALGGKLNLYRFFVIRSLNLLRKNGRYGMILPLSLLADISCSQSRRYLMANSKNLVADCFPQKDNSNRRVFRDAKLSTSIITCEKELVGEKEAQIQIRVFPWNKFEDTHKEAVIRLSDIALIDPENAPIPLVTENEWTICRNIYLRRNIVRLGEIHDFSVTRGEINQTVFRSYISENDKNSRLLKGVEIGQFRLNQKLSQGKREYFDEKVFLQDNKPKQVIKQRRIATQRITGVDERLRIVATIIDPPAYFADSTNSITKDGASPYKLEYVLGILNSYLYQWRFKLTSSNNNVGTNELDSMPFRTINFSDPAEKARHDQMVTLVERMLALHKNLASAKTPQEKESMQRQVESTDGAIDNLVYELYGLTEEEIGIVEGT